PALPGRLILVGAGPGPASLLTLQGLRALNEADVIVHDEGVSDEVLALARRDADVVKWNTHPGDGLADWTERLEYLGAQVEKGCCVVYLQPGDAWQPGSNSVLACPSGITMTYEVVPGIP